MASQKYTIALNSASTPTAINVWNDKNSVIYSISGSINAYANPSTYLGKGFTYTISNANGAGSITTAGTGYTDGTYTGVWLSGGSGAGSRYTIVVSGGVVTTVTKTSNSTTNYTVGDVLTISSLPYAYESIVLMNANTIPNQVGQQFSMPLNSIVSVGGVDTTAYTNVQIMKAIQDLASSCAYITVNLSTGAMSDLDSMTDSLVSIDNKTPSLGQVTFSNSSPVNTQNKMLDVVCEITRPANATAYSANDAISTGFVVSGATNATPIVITTSTAHGLADGQPVLISGVGGNTAANAFSYAKVTGYSSTTFALYSDAALTSAVAGNGAYTSGGSVAAGFVFSGLPANCEGYITKVRVGTSDTGVSGVTPIIQLYTNAASPIADNAAFTLLYTNFNNRIGGVSTMPSLTTMGAGSTMYSSILFGAIKFKADANGRVYALLATNAAFTPSANSTLFSITLSFDIQYIP